MHFFLPSKAMRAVFGLLLALAAFWYIQSWAFGGEEMGLAKPPLYIAPAA